MPLFVMIVLLMKNSQKYTIIKDIASIYFFTIKVNVCLYGFIGHHFEARELKFGT